VCQSANAVHACQAQLEKLRREVSTLSQRTGAGEDEAYDSWKEVACNTQDVHSGTRPTLPPLPLEASSAVAPRSSSDGTLATTLCGLTLAESSPAGAGSTSSATLPRHPVRLHLPSESESCNLSPSQEGSARFVDEGGIHCHDEGKLVMVRMESLEKGLHAAGSERAALGDRVAASSKRLEAIEGQLDALRGCIAIQTVMPEQGSCQDAEQLRAPHHLDSQFEAKAEELQRQLGTLDSQGRDICDRLKEQGQRRCQFEEGATQRLESVERRLDSDVALFRKDMSRLREALDVETMVREDADARLQGCVEEADSASQALKRAMSDVSASLKAQLSISFAECWRELERISAEQGRCAKAAAAASEESLGGLAEAEEMRLRHVEDQLRSCARTSEREIAAVRGDLLGVQESVLVDAMSCSTSSLFRRVVALEGEKERASTRSAQQFSAERKVHETEAVIHREETIRALREERELREQGHMQLERRWRVEAEAHTKEKERRKEVEFSLDQRITDLSKGYLEACHYPATLTRFVS